MGPRNAPDQGEVGLVVERGGADVREVAHGHPRHTQQGVGSHLGEAEIREGHAPQAHRVHTDGEIHHVLLGRGPIPRLAHQPELVGTGATVEVVGAGPSEDGEDIVALAAQGPVAAAADDEFVMAGHAAEAVLTAVDRPDLVAAAAAGDHIAAARVHHVGTGSGEDLVVEAAGDRHIHLVVAGAGEHGVQATVEAGDR